MNVNTQKMGIIGANIAYSLSPRIHAVAMQALGIEGTYMIFDIPSPALIPAFLRQFWDEGGLGLNITTPYKALVAEIVGNAGVLTGNTLYRGDAGWCLASTDGEGLKRALLRHETDFNEFTAVLILGAGGVVYSILSSLVQQQFPGKVVVLRRSSHRDALVQDAAGTLHMGISDLVPGVLGREFCNTERPLLLQATNAPASVLTDLAEELKGQKEGLVVDLNYAAPSPLVQRAQALGIAAMDGLPMLIEQARLAQELWWGRSCSYEALVAGIRT